MILILALIILSSLTIDATSSFSSFVTCMSPFKRFEAGLLGLPDWQLIKNSYDAHIIYKGCYSEQPKIPKIIHHIWLGSPFPEHLSELRKTWKKFHPSWQMILWTDKEVDEFNLKNRRLYDLSENYGSKSDIARLEILYRMGGLYVDTDFECLKSFDELHHLCDFYAGIGYDAPQVVLYNSLIASTPENPILKLCVETMLSQEPADKHDFWAIMEKTGSILLTKSFFSIMHSEINYPAIAFPTSYFFPWPAELRHDPRTAHQWINSNSYALHLWHTSWQKNL